MREIRIERALPDHAKGRDVELETPKSGHGRTVDMSRHLAVVLRAHEVHAETQQLRLGEGSMPPWLFCTTGGRPFDATNVQKRCGRS